MKTTNTCPEATGFDDEFVGRQMFLPKGVLLRLSPSEESRHWSEKIGSPAHCCVRLSRGVGYVSNFWFLP